jgi:hypothetical protein
MGRWNRNILKYCCIHIFANSNTGVMMIRRYALAWLDPSTFPSFCTFGVPILAGRRPRRVVRLGGRKGRAPVGAAPRGFPNGAGVSTAGVPTNRRTTSTGSSGPACKSH